MKAMALNGKGQILIPAGARRQAGLRPGDRREVELRGGAILLKKAASDFDLESLRKGIQDYYQGRDLEAGSMAERRRDGEREKKNRR